MTLKAAAVELKWHGWKTLLAYHSCEKWPQKMTTYLWRYSNQHRQPAGFCVLALMTGRFTQAPLLLDKCEECGILLPRLDSPRSMETLAHEFKRTGNGTSISWFSGVIRAISPLDTNSASFTAKGTDEIINLNVWALALRAVFIVGTHLKSIAFSTVIDHWVSCFCNHGKTAWTSPPPPLALH